MGCHALHQRQRVANPVGARGGEAVGLGQLRVDLHNFLNEHHEGPKGIPQQKLVAIARSQFGNAVLYVDVKLRCPCQRLN